MKDAGVDVVFMCTDANAVLTLEQELERQGMSDVVVFMQQSIGDPTIFERGGSLIEGNVSFTLSVPGFAPGEAAATYSEGIDRKSVVEGKRGSVRVELGGRGCMKKKK